MNWTDELFAGVYEELGVPAELTLDGSGEEPVTVVVLDKTAGMEVEIKGTGTVQVRPIAILLAAELIEYEIAIDDLNGASISFNGGDWTIISNYPRPSPNGMDDGEYLLVLRKASGA